MNYIKMYKTYKELMSNQYLDRDNIRKIQEYKLRRLVKEAYNNVPYYKDLFDDGGISDADIQTVDDLKKIPVTTKAVLQKQENNSIINNRMNLIDLKSERSSGSTGNPFTVYFDQDYSYIRNALFLRGLMTAGYRFGQKLLLFAGPGKKSNAWLRWRYVSLHSPQDVLLDNLNKFQPNVLYGRTTPLRLFAEYIQNENITPFKPEKIITTAEMLDSPTRELLENTFIAEVFDFYGMAEIGFIGWECAEHGGYHLAEDTMIIENVVDNESLNQKLIITSLDSIAMPLIRYDVGDIFSIGSNSRCACGRNFSLMERVEGRIVDCIQLKNGNKISPYKFISVFKNIQGLQRFQVIQESYTEVKVIVEINQERSFPEIKRDIDNAMQSLLGHDIGISINLTEKIITPQDRKFRVVESRL